MIGNAGIEAYTSALQHIAEASVGWCWVKEGMDMVPYVSPLVETFLAVTGLCMPPHIIR